MLLCEQLERRFGGPAGEVAALAGVSLRIDRGEFVVIKGPSGCGKSTLLLTMGGMQRPSRGNLLFLDQNLYEMPAARRNRVRSKHIGFVFQLFHLIPYLTVRENILAGLPPGDSSRLPLERVDDLMSELGLGHRALHKPGSLSAGERQRTALARALIKKPDVILADEPTGNLDPVNAAYVFRFLGEYHRSGGTVVVVTHGQDAAGYASRTLHMASGRLSADPPPPETSTTSGHDSTPTIAAKG